LRTMTDTVRKDPLSNKGSQPETLGSRPPTAADMKGAQAPFQVRKPVAAPDKPQQVEEKAAATPESHASSDQGYSKEVWYGIGTICGALFTSIVAPLVVDLIRHCVGFGSSFPRSRFRDID